MRERRPPSLDMPALVELKSPAMTGKDHCAQKVSTQGRNSTSVDHALRGWRSTSR